MADLAVTEKSKEDEKTQKSTPESLEIQEDTDIEPRKAEKKVNHSYVQSFPEDVLDNPKKGSNPSMLHLENSGNFMKDQNVLLSVHFNVNSCYLADL